MTPLADTEWTVVAYAEGRGGFASVLAGTNLTVAFSADGRISGSGGCNGFAGTFALTPPAIRIGPVATTRKFCASPDGVMAQESAFFAALTTAASFTSNARRSALDGGRRDCRRASRSATGVAGREMPAIYRVSVTAIVFVVGLLPLEGENSMLRRTLSRPLLAMAARPADVAPTLTRIVPA